MPSAQVLAGSGANDAPARDARADSAFVRGCVALEARLSDRQLLLLALGLNATVWAALGFCVWALFAG